MENEENWTAFCFQLRRALSERYGEFPIVVMSDRDKGLMNAVENVFGRDVPHGYCIWHVTNNNSKKGLKRAVCNAIARAKSEDELREVIGMLSANAREAAWSLPLDHISRARFPTRRFGFTASSVDESANNFLYRVRCKRGLEMMMHFVSVMNRRFEKIHEVIQRIVGHYSLCPTSKLPTISTL